MAYQFIGLLFSELWLREDCAHKVNGTVRTEYASILDMRTLALDWLGYHGSGLRTYYLTCPGCVFVPLLKGSNSCKNVEHFCHRAALQVFFKWYPPKVLPVGSITVTNVTTHALNNKHHNIIISINDKR